MGTGRKKIPMKKIENIYNRRVTFTKRRNGLFKKAEKLALLTGCKVAILTMSSANNTFFYGDEELLYKAAAAAASTEFGNFDSAIKTNALEVGGSFSGCYQAGHVVVADNASCVVQVGNSTSPTEEADSGNPVKGFDDMDTIFTDEELERLLADEECNDHTHDADVGADKDNAVSGMLDPGSSDGVNMVMPCPWKNSNWYNDTSPPLLQPVPCSSSAEYLSNGFSFADYDDINKSCTGMELVGSGSRSDAAAGTSGPKASDGISEKEELEQLLLSRQGNKAFVEAMREQYRLAMKAGEMISEDDPLIYF